MTTQEFAEYVRAEIQVVKKAVDAAANKTSNVTINTLIEHVHELAESSSSVQDCARLIRAVACASIIATTAIEESRSTHSNIGERLQ